MSADPRRRLLIQAALSLPVLGWLPPSAYGATSAESAGTHPPWSGKMTDQEIADVVSYVRNAWSNRGSNVNAESVAASGEQAQRLGDLETGYAGMLNRPQAVRAPPLR